MSKEAGIEKESRHPSVFSVENKIVVITGGLGQLGSTYAKAFLENGARVVTMDVETLDEGHPSDLYSFLGKDDFLHKVVDVRKKVTLQQALDEIVKEWSDIPEVLVNNAALDSPPNAPDEEVGPFETYPEESFENVMDVNVNGTFKCCQVFGGAMAKAGRGAIINISSIYGILSPCQDIYEFRRKEGGTFNKPVAYSVSKSAIMNFTRYLATYWAKQGVRVNTLTLAGIFNNQPEEFLKGYCARIPIGRMADASEYVGPVLFLASDASLYMTGSNMIVDGGWSAW
jgi:NAD(P)-dependent dehydrogenase (short-subunit alcohol dehydrogenase family)